MSTTLFSSFWVDLQTRVSFLHLPQGKQSLQVNITGQGAGCSSDVSRSALTGTSEWLSVSQSGTGDFRFVAKPLSFLNNDDDCLWKSGCNKLCIFNPFRPKSRLWHHLSSYWSLRSHGHWVVSPVPRLTDSFSLLSNRNFYLTSLKNLSFSWTTPAAPQGSVFWANDFFKQASPWAI